MKYLVKYSTKTLNNNFRNGIKSENMFSLTGDSCFLPGAFNSVFCFRQNFPSDCILTFRRGNFDCKLVRNRWRYWAAISRAQLFGVMTSGIRILLIGRDEVVVRNVFAVLAASWHTAVSWNVAAFASDFTNFSHSSQDPCTLCFSFCSNNKLFQDAHPYVTSNAALSYTLIPAHLR